MEIAVITGASSGIGQEYVKEVLKLYPCLDEVWVIARRKERLEALKEELGGKIRVLAMDITDETKIQEYAELLAEKGVSVKLLVNNAGFGKIGNFYQIPAKESSDMIRLNCEALTVMSTVTVPFMKKGAQIINLCSIASFAPNARMAVYSSTKAFVMSFSRCMRMELKDKGISVTAVCPGPMDTEFLPVANITDGVSKTFDTLPRVNPEVMARKSLVAAKRGKAVYTNRLIYKFYRLIAKLLPHSIVMKFCAT